MQPDEALPATDTLLNSLRSGTPCSLYGFPVSVTTVTTTLPDLTLMSAADLLQHVCAARRELLRSTFHNRRAYRAAMAGRFRLAWWHHDRSVERGIRFANRTAGT